MRVRIKLTTLCDSDLLILNSISEFGFRGWLRSTLQTYASTGDIKKVPLPTAPPDKPKLKNQMFSITFDMKKDYAVMEMLNAVQNRMRSGLIKSILRSSLARPCLYAYFNAYPAPFPVTRPESGEPVEHTASAVVSPTAIPMPTTSQVLGEPPENFNIFGFKDEII